MTWVLSKPTLQWEMQYNWRVWRLWIHRSNKVHCKTCYCICSQGSYFKTKVCDQGSNNRSFLHQMENVTLKKLYISKMVTKRYLCFMTLLACWKVFEIIWRKLILKSTANCKLAVHSWLLWWAVFVWVSTKSNISRSRLPSVSNTCHDQICRQV